MSELHPNVHAEMDLMWEQRALELVTYNEPTREEAIDSAVDYLYGLGSLDEKTPRGASARKLRENLGVVWGLDPETSAATTTQGLLDKAREYDRLKINYESAQRLEDEFYDIQEVLTGPLSDEQDVVDEARLKQWFEHLSQLRDLKPKEQAFIEYGVASLDEGIVANRLNGIREGYRSPNTLDVSRSFIAHWLLNNADSHEIVQEASEAYNDFIGSDEAKRELDDYFTRGEIRQLVKQANETGDTGSRYTAASILWAFAHERESIRRPDIVIGALARIAMNEHEDDWSDDDFAESIKIGVVEDALDEETAKFIIELVANYGRSGHYPAGLSAKELGLAVGTLAKLGNLELPETPQSQELSA